MGEGELGPWSSFPHAEPSLWADPPADADSAGQLLTDHDTKRLASRFPLQGDMTSFYNTPPLGQRGTCSYLMKVVMNLLLQGEVRPSGDDPCPVS